MREWMQWTDEHRTTRKTGGEQRKVTSACGDQHLLPVNEGTASSRQLAALWSTATGVLMSDETLFKICGTKMAAFVLDAMSVNATFQSALSNDIVT
ncbi:transposable element Tcb2 transposase [Trichonephila clavipes]|nr:transposable element Tcb2 transposase [Trichonephila clavipes]